MSQGRFVLTGATGILGSWVLAEGIRRGYSPIAIMRDRSIDAARGRLKSVLEIAGLRGAESDVDVVIGDSTKENLGLHDADVKRLHGSLDGLIHCAACTSFSPSQDEEVNATNIGGTTNVLQLAERTCAPLYHVSTAYVCGRRTGTVMESDLEHGAGYNNTYERSKNSAEQFVRTAFKTDQVRGAVFRPGIIVGATQSGRICQFSNFYSMLQAIEFGVRRAQRNGKVVRIAGDGACTKNLVPVDWAASQLWGAIEAEGPSCATYHLTNPAPPTMSFIVEWLNELFDDKGVRVEMLPVLDESDGLMQRATKPFEGYLLEEPVFDRTNMDRATGYGTPCPEFTAEFMTALFRYAQSQQWRSVLDARRREDVLADGASEPSESSSTAATCLPS